MTPKDSELRLDCGSLSEKKPNILDTAHNSQKR